MCTLNSYQSHSYYLQSHNYHKEIHNYLLHLRRQRHVITTAKIEITATMLPNISSVFIVSSDPLETAKIAYGLNLIFIS